MITKSIKFNVIQSPRGGSILVPGCEPSTTITSVTMDAQIRAQGLCNGSIADVDDILEAIPGSYIELLPNMGFYGARRLLVLPAVDQTCPCTVAEDYYAIIRSLARGPTEEEESLINANCDAFATDPCQVQSEDRAWRSK